MKKKNIIFTFLVKSLFFYVTIQSLDNTKDMKHF